MKMLTEDDFVKGVKFSDTIPPEYSSMNLPDNWFITQKEIEYFKENGLIRKAYKVLSEAKD